MSPFQVDEANKAITALEALLDDGADVNARDAEGITPLMHAARGERPEIANPAPTDRPEVVELLARRRLDAIVTFFFLRLQVEVYEAAYRARVVKGLVRKAAELGYRLEPATAT